MAKLEIFKYDRIRVRELLSDTLTFITDRFSQSKKIFSVASVYGQILYVLENLTNLMLYYIEDSISEMSIREATRESSVYSRAAEAGYMPSRSVAATGQIALTKKTNLTEDMANSTIMIPNYLKIRCKNTGIDYIINMSQDYIKINLGEPSQRTSDDPENIFDGKYCFNILQGTIDTQTLSSGTGHPYASYVINYPKNYHIDNNFVKVYVNGVYQPNYTSILKIPAGEPGCMIRTGVESGIDVFFGNGTYGSYPEYGAEITAEYLITDGYRGCIKNAEVGDVVWEFVESGFTESGEEVDLNEVFDINTIMAPDFGHNAEDIELTRMMLSKSVDRLVVEADYELLLKRMQTFSIVRVIREANNNRKFNLFLVPDVKKLLTRGMNYFNIPEAQFKLTQEKKNKLLQYIEKMGIKTISNDITITDPVISKYVINVTIIKTDGDYEDDAIRADIVSAMSDYFISVERRDRIPKSDLIRIIEGIDGVDSVYVKIISKKNEDMKMRDPNADETGLDEFNDIIMDDNELVIIRGGWSDRYGNYYNTSTTTDGSLGAININFKNK